MLSLQLFNNGAVRADMTPIFPHGSTLFAAMRVARRYLFDKTRVRVVLDRICSGGGARGLDSLLSLNKG